MGPAADPETRATLETIRRTEDLFATGDRCLVRWSFHWDDQGGHVRGVDVFRVRGGKVSEKLAYVMG
jgi:hypothetical protein